VSSVYGICREKEMVLGRIDFWLPDASDLVVLKKHFYKFELNIIILNVANNLSRKHAKKLYTNTL
jgi:hypothetical protein